MPSKDVAVHGNSGDRFILTRLHTIAAPSLLNSVAENLGRRRLVYQRAEHTEIRPSAS